MGRNVVFDDQQQQKILADAGGSAAPPAQGPAIAVANGWASPSGDQDRTTVVVTKLGATSAARTP